MKKRFLNYSLNIIKMYNPNIDEIRLDELRYGLEGFYLTITKLVVIVILSLLLGIFKEMFIMLIAFNILRFTGFGLHATKSSICLFSSSLIFIIFPFLSKIISFPIYLKMVLILMAIILIFLYAPADTEKRPIINVKRRKIYKWLTTINCIILSIISLFISDIYFNLIIFGIYSEVIMILPITYKIFNLSYNNYKKYGLNIENV